MVLLIDISAENEALLHTQTDKIITLTQARRGECFVAKSLEKRQIFWQDRANTAAIAAHTNAFKINEDVVIPLDKLSDYMSSTVKLTTGWMVLSGISPVY
jgi:FAD/FMN-containing dehydrogenase